MNKKPKIGQKIYVGPSDDYNAGICTVKSVIKGISGGKPTWYVTFKERYSYSQYNYKYLDYKRKK